VEDSVLHSSPDEVMVRVVGPALCAFGGDVARDVGELHDRALAPIVTIGSYLEHQTGAGEVVHPPGGRKSYELGRVVEALESIRRHSKRGGSTYGIVREEPGLTDDDDEARNRIVLG